MRSIARILNSLAPIVNVLGIVAFILIIVKGHFKIMIPMVVLFAVGLIFGKQAFKQNCPPRIFWARKFTPEFSNRSGYRLWIDFCLLGSRCPILYIVVLIGWWKIFASALWFLHLCISTIKTKKQFFNSLFYFLEIKFRSAGIKKEFKEMFIGE